MISCSTSPRFVWLWGKGFRLASSPLIYIQSQERSIIPLHFRPPWTHQLCCPPLIHSEKWPRGHHLSVSAGTRRTPCAVVVGPKPTTCRSLPAASVATLRSARESTTGALRPRGGTPLAQAVWDTWRSSTADSGKIKKEQIKKIFKVFCVLIYQALFSVCWNSI